MATDPDEPKPQDKPSDSDHFSTAETQFLPPDPAEKAAPPRSKADPKHKYQVLRSLGKGGFAWVYLVKNLDLDRLEAIKVLSSKLEEEDLVDRFVKEARIAANFNHQNIVTIYEVQKNGRWTDFEVEDTIRNRHLEPFAYFTMSFVEGNTATNLIRASGRMSERKAIKICIDTCMALEYAHGKGVVHRDIKPDNILVDRMGSGIVTDFGIAKAADQTRLTAAGTFMGTARYVSPEQALGQEIDGRSDLYSLGVTLYEMVTGRVPFESDAWMTVLYQHIHEAPSPPEAFNAQIDRDLQRVILRMLEKKPEKRFQNARECAEVLSKLYHRMGGADLRTEAIDQIGTRPNYMQDPGTQETVVKKPEPPVRSKASEEIPIQAPQPKSGGRGRLWLATSLVLVTLVLAGYWLLRPQPKPQPPPVLTQGEVLVSAFPKGQITQIVHIVDGNREIITPPESDTPQRLKLPLGEYEIVIAYEGTYKKEFTLVTADQPARVHAEFNLESERFLLGDLK
ncbi:MAG: serine/threonine protein kinase [Acidobacteria bacterium]|nr:serine/threonine protein kinase [Acidobacteriota bacterium]MCB9397590.1 serine/threonine protein kinase [Acidobacteriota bacterium]